MHPRIKPAMPFGQFLAPVQLLSSTSTDQFYVANVDTLHVVPAGLRPSVLIVSNLGPNALITAQCSILGSAARSPPPPSRCRSIHGPPFGPPKSMSKLPPPAIFRRLSRKAHSHRKSSPRFISAALRLTTSTAR